MRKTLTPLALLLLTAVWVAPRSAEAGVYSRNVVGYINVAAPAGFSIMSNPLLDTSPNSADLSYVMPIGGGGSIGTELHRWDPSLLFPTFRPVVVWNGTQWTVNSTAANPYIIPPGEAFYIVPNGGPVWITLMGEVAQGSLSHAVAGGTALQAWSLQASEVPQAADLQQLLFPAADGDTAFPYNQGAYDVYLYDWGMFGGWDPVIDGPTIPLAAGFWSRKPAGPVPWNRAYTPTTTAGGPILTITRAAGGNAVVSWDILVTGYVLEQTPTLFPELWTVATGTFGSTPTEWQVTVPAVGTAKFYRLRQ